jgi:hypothetical protein
VKLYLFATIFRLALWYTQSLPYPLVAGGYFFRDFAVGAYISPFKYS